MTDDLNITPAESISSASSVVAEKITSQETTKMKDGDIRWRAKYKGVKDELETTLVQTEKEKKELSSKMNLAMQEKENLQNRYISAELKAHAVAAGLKDLDLVKLIDISNIKIMEDGTINGIEESITEFRTRKPDFFGTDKKINSSTNAPFVTTEKPATKSAWAMTTEEFSKASRQIQRGKYKF